MPEMPPDLIDMLKDPRSPRALATCDPEGRLNVVPKMSLSPVDPQTVVFADILGEKTNANLRDTGSAAFTVFRVELPPLGYQVKGRFQGFFTSGALFEKMRRDVKRTLGMKVRSVGLIKVESVWSVAPPNAGARLA